MATRRPKSVIGPRAPRTARQDEDDMLQQALRASKEEAALDRARKESEKSEEVRMLEQALLLSSLSGAQDQASLDRRLAKGKHRAVEIEEDEDVEDPREKAALAEALCLSLIDSSDRRRSWAARIDLSEHAPQSYGHQRRRSFFVSNPDLASVNKSAAKPLDGANIDRSRLTSTIDYIAPARSDYAPPFLLSAPPEQRNAQHSGAATEHVHEYTSSNDIERAQDGAVPSEETDPFDDVFAADDTLSIGETTTATPPDCPLLQTPNESRGLVDKPAPSSPVSFSEAESPGLSSTSDETSITSCEPEHSSGPLYGGFVDSTSVNALADETIVAGVKFGFVSGETRHMHAPLDYSGTFPDVAQLSRIGGLEGTDKEFECFAVEAPSWKTLLTYLMWHGHSRIEAAPYDLSHEKIGAGLTCAVVVEFFLSFETGKPRVRCRLDLLAPGASTMREEKALQSDSFMADCPNITMALPFKPVLPFDLSSLATQLSSAHTFARQAQKAMVTGGQSDCTGLQGLPRAIDLFRKLNGETFDKFSSSAAHEVEDEISTMQKIKFKLRRGRKAGRVRGAEPAGTPVHYRDELPEDATLFTPFRLDV